MHGLYYNYTLKKINEMPLYDAVKPSQAKKNHKLNLIEIKVNTVASADLSKIIFIQISFSPFPPRTPMPHLQGFGVVRMHGTLSSLPSVSISNHLRCCCIEHFRLTFGMHRYLCTWSLLPFALENWTAKILTHWVKGQQLNRLHFLYFFLKDMLALLLWKGTP